MERKATKVGGLRGGKKGKKRVERKGGNKMEKNETSGNVALDN